LSTSSQFILNVNPQGFLFCLWLWFVGVAIFVLLEDTGGKRWAGVSVCALAPASALSASIMRAPFLVALVTLPLVFASNFHHKIHSLAAAHAKASKNDRIKTLLAANGTNATSPLSPPANLVSLAAINGTFQIYNSGSLPLNPAPPTACATALTSSIACNETVQLLPYDYFS
jgi:hypothetical protein